MRILSVCESQKSRSGFSFARAFLDVADTSGSMIEWSWGFCVAVGHMAWAFELGQNRRSQLEVGPQITSKCHPFGTVADADAFVQIQTCRNTLKMSPMIHDGPHLTSSHQFQDNHNTGWGVRSYVCARCIIKDYPGEAGTASNAMHLKCNWIQNYIFHMLTFCSMWAFSTSAIPFLHFNKG